MKRQVAILGPTPEFLRWSVRQTCLMRADTEVSSVDQTEKRLHAIRVAGQAIGQGRVFHGIAVDRIPGVDVAVNGEPLSARNVPLDAPKGFRLQEVFALWDRAEGDGQQAVEAACRSCVANLVGNRLQNGNLAGCHGWLLREPNLAAFWRAFESVAAQRWMYYRGSKFLPTDPHWYGLWVSPTIGKLELEWLHASLTHAIKLVAISDCESNGGLRDFHRVVAGCLEHGLALDVEAMPRGNSDGLFWTLAPFCDRCRSTRPLGKKFACSVCGKPGGGHPAIKRKVRGLRPFVDLAIVLGKEGVEPFMGSLLRQAGQDGGDRQDRIAGQD